MVKHDRVEPEERGPSSLRLPRRVGGGEEDVSSTRESYGLRGGLAKDQPQVTGLSPTGTPRVRKNRDRKDPGLCLFRAALALQASHSMKTNSPTPSVRCTLSAPSDAPDSVPSGTAFAGAAAGDSEPEVEAAARLTTCAPRSSARLRLTLGRLSRAAGVAGVLLLGEAEGVRVGLRGESERRRRSAAPACFASCSPHTNFNIRGKLFEKHRSLPQSTLKDHEVGRCNHPDRTARLIKLIAHAVLCASAMSHLQRSSYQNHSETRVVGRTMATAAAGVPARYPSTLSRSDRTIRPSPKNTPPFRVFVACG